jgi:hypothetical protein
MATFSKAFHFIQHCHWPGPRSLATTYGVSVDVLSCRYLDVSVPCVRFLPLCIQGKIPYYNAWKPKPYRSTTWILQAFKVGSPIRKSMDQSLFAAPHGLSQRITSFFACACQGIHQMPLIHLFVLIVYAHPYWFDLAEPYLLACAQRGCQIVALRQPLGMRKTTQNPVTFYNQVSS